MIRLILPFLFCLLTLNLSAQDQDLLYGQYLLDSIQQLPPMDTTDYELIEVNMDFSVIHANVYFECNGDECFEARKGLITSTNDTLPPVFYDIIPLGTGELVLIGLQKTIQIGAGMYITNVYDHFGLMIEDLAVFMKNGQYGLMSKAGELLLEPTYAYIENNEDNYVVLAQKDGSWTALDKDVILNREKGDIFEDAELVNTLLKVQNPENYLWAFFSQDVEQLSPYKYEEVNFTNYGDATASIDNYWGMINAQGKEATEFEYDEIHSGMGVTYIGVQGLFSEEYGLVSAEGALTPVKYSKITTRPLYSNRTKEYYWIAKESNGNWGLLRLRGQTLADFIYEEIDSENEESPKGLLNGKWVELIE